MKDKLQGSLFSPSAMWVMWLTLRSSGLVHIPLPTEASHQLVNYSSASFCGVQQIDFNFLWAVNLLKMLFLLQLRWGRRCSWRTSGTMTLQGCHQSVCWGIFCSTWTDIMGGSWTLQMLVSSLRFPYCLAAVSGGIRQEEVPAGCTLWYYSTCSIIWIITGFVVPVRVSAYQDLSIGVTHSASSHRWMELVKAPWSLSMVVVTAGSPGSEAAGPKELVRKTSRKWCSRATLLSGVCLWFPEKDKCFASW